MEDYPKEQILQLIEYLPKDLKEALFSERTSEAIYNVCKKNNLPDEKIPELAKYVGYALVGLLPPSDFQKKIEKELQLESEVAKEINHAINRFVFFSVRSSLDAIYNPAKPEQKIEENKQNETVIKEETKKTSAQRDIYREPID